ncbi:MAG: hypothetical protein ABW007_16300 [Chitinophagaceae bacterium]
MAKVTGFTAERMLVIENETVVDGEVQGDNLILLTREGTPIDAGNVRGPQGIQGPPGAASGVSSVNDQSGAVYAPRIFVSKAALDANWAAAPVGSMAVTTDTETVWEKNATTWVVTNAFRVFTNAADRDSRWVNPPRGATAIIQDFDSLTYKSSAGWNSSDGVRSFATVTERNARWPSPPQGAICITIDTYTLWKYTSSGWLAVLPAVQGQPGTAIRFGSVPIPNINQVGNYVFDVVAAEGGLTYPYRTLVNVSSDLYAGYGAAEGLGQTDIVAYFVGGAVATSATVGIPGARYMPFPLSAAWYPNTGQDCGFKVRFYNHSTTNFHTAGQLTWTIFAAY